MTIIGNINNDKLSPREKEAAFYIMEGLSTNLIARKIGVKSNTVSTIKKNIFQKLEVNSIVELYKLLRD